MLHLGLLGRSKSGNLESHRATTASNFRSSIRAYHVGFCVKSWPFIESPDRSSTADSTLDEHAVATTIFAATTFGFAISENPNQT